MFRSMRTTRGLLLFGLALASVAAWATPASAQFFGRVANEPFSGRVTVVNKIKAKLDLSELYKDAHIDKAGNKSSELVNLLKNAGQHTSGPEKPTTPTGPLTTVDLGPVLANAWHKARPKIIEKALAFLNEKNIGSGFRTSRNHLDLDNDGELFVGVDGRGMTFRYVLRGNQFTTKLRTPTPVGSWGDPGFRVKFDMEVLIDVEIHGTSLVVGAAKLNMHVSRPTGTNITGTLTVAVANLIDTLTGKDFIGEGLSVVNGKEFALSAPIKYELSKLSPILAKAASKGVVVPSFDKAHNRVVLTLIENTPLPVVR